MSMTLNDNGTVTFDLEGKDNDGNPTSTSILLRRPTLGEYRDVLREPLDEIVDTANDAIDVINDMSEAAEGQTKEEQKAKIPEARKLRREWGRKLDSMRAEWFRQVMITLGPVDIDFTTVDIPLWALDPDLAGELVSHWRTRPGPPSGGQ